VQTEVSVDVSGGEATGDEQVRGSVCGSRQPDSPTPALGIFTMRPQADAAMDRFSESADAGDFYLDVGGGQAQVDRDSHPRAPVQGLPCVTGRSVGAQSTISAAGR
jgi:hypothetical protein